MRRRGSKTSRWLRSARQIFLAAVLALPVLAWGDAATALPSTRTIQVPVAGNMYGSAHNVGPFTSEPIELDLTIEPFDESLGQLVAVRPTSRYFFTYGGALEVEGGYFYEQITGVTALQLLTFTLESQDGTILGEGGASDINVFEIFEPGLYPTSTGGGEDAVARFRITDPELLAFFTQTDDFVARMAFLFRLNGVDLPASEVRWSGSFSVFRGAIEYEYIPVPEPNTAFLIASGLVLLAHRRRPGRG